MASDSVDNDAMSREQAVEIQPPPKPLLLLRGGVGGVFMGLANLVPGISGGTMLLATGVYTHFITAVGEVTALKFRRSSLLILAAVVVTAALTIFTLAKPVQGLVLNHRWAMYSLFIGLTLGGVPVVWRLIGKLTASVAIGTIFGFIVMVGVAMLQHQSARPGESTSITVMFFAGVIGASAMILPGISGAYLLLVMGVYVPILGAVALFKDAITSGSFSLAVDPALRVVLPVGIGVLVGMAVVSNLIRLLLDKFEKPTLGVLLGLLLGSVVGLYPFYTFTEPSEGMLIKQQAITQVDSVWVYADSRREVKSEDYPVEKFRPSTKVSGAAVGLALLGFAITTGVSRLGRNGGDGNGSTSQRHSEHSEHSEHTDHNAPSDKSESGHRYS